MQALQTVQAGGGAQQATLHDALEHSQRYLAHLCRYLYITGEVHRISPPLHIYNSRGITSHSRSCPYLPTFADKGRQSTGATGYTCMLSCTALESNITPIYCCLTPGKITPQCPQLRRATAPVTRHASLRRLGTWRTFPAAGVVVALRLERQRQRIPADDEFACRSTPARAW